MRRITLGLLAGFALTVGFSLETQAADPVGKFAGASLTVSRWAGDPWTAAQVKAAEAWSVATGGKVTVDAIPYENLHDKDALEMANGMFDIMYVHPSWFGEYASSGGLRAIDDFLANPAMNPPGYSADSFVPSVLAQGKYDGKQYCLPDFISSVIL